MQSGHNEITVNFYSSQFKILWDDFLDASKNGHFFFKRDYMEYHSNRFQDLSLMFFKGGKLIAVMPANVVGDTLYSHQGLTYGGIIYGVNISTVSTIEVFDEMCNFLKKMGIRKLIYKAIPYIYFKQAADEAIYALYLKNAKIIKRELSSVIYLNSTFKYTKGKKYNIAKARKHELTVIQNNNYHDFMGLLSDVLNQRHSVNPVHNLQEIEYLASCFPKNIKLYSCYKNEKIVAGTIIFENDQVAHTQYLANSDEGKEIGALDFTLDYLIKNIYFDKKYFSFGISTENDGQKLNHGLVDSKEGFGARAILHDIYELTL